MPVVLRWTPTSRDVRLAVRTARLARPFTARHASRILAAFVLVVVVVVSLLWYPIWPGLSGLVALLLIGDYFTDRAAWRGNAYVRQPTEATLAEDELRLTGTGAVRFLSAWPWSAFRHVLETDEQFVLVGPQEQHGFVPYLPKQPETRDQVRQLLADRLEIRSAG